MQQVLHMQRVHPIFRVILDDLVGDEERFVGVCGSKSIHSETTGKTGDRSEETLECLGQVMGDEVFVDLK